MPFLFRQRYEFVAQLGRGGMGAVFKARDHHAPQRPWVAVKVAQLKGSAAIRHMLEEAFRREGQAAGMLSQHVKYFVGFRGSDFSEPAYLVLDFVEWPTLDIMRKQTGVFPPVKVAALGVEIVRGVRCMERRRMVHRDLKPENIFARRTGDGFEVKIADLGVWVDSGEAYETSLFGTAETRLAGTPAYMSPEQTRSEALTSASDLHMVSSILWELATGQVPYPFRTAPTLAEALRNRHERMRTPPDRPPGMPEGLFRILASGLQFDPGMRGCIDATAASSEAGPARRMEKALDDFIVGYADTQRRLMQEADDYTKRSREGLIAIEPMIAQARGLIARAEQLHQRVEQVAAATLAPNRHLEESARISADVEDFLQEARTLLGGASSKTLPLPLTENGEPPLSQAEARGIGGRQTEQAADAKPGGGGGRGLLAAMIAVTGALGLLSGALLMHAATTSSAEGSGSSADVRPVNSSAALSDIPSLTAQTSTPPGTVLSASTTAPEPPVTMSTSAVPSNASASAPQVVARPTTAPKAQATRVGPICGDGICGENEGVDICCYDCCPGHDGFCDHGENQNSADCRAAPKPMDLPSVSRPSKLPPAKKYDDLNYKDL